MTFTNSRRSVIAPLSCVLAAAGLSLAAPAGARAAAVVYEGDALVLRASPGERNFVVVDGSEPGRISFTDDQPIQFPAGPCEQGDPEYPVSCQAPTRAVRLELGDGDDTASFGFQIPATLAFQVNGGPGADLLKGPRNGIGSATLDGGPGNDDLRSEETADTLIGGEGDDKLEGGAGRDVLHGGGGDDLLRADAPGGIFGDVIDGGAGNDTLDEYGDGDAATAPPVDILLDGIANDGRPGENDNITAVETIKAGAIRTFAGDDGPNQFLAPEKGGPARIGGGGGDDVLQAGDASGDRVDGGPGNDRIAGGMGDDVITGGPGRDEIAGDRPGRCNELHCDITDGYGNDTIDARDGEADSVMCGPGIDTVRADPADTIAKDCERVDVSGSPRATTRMRLTGRTRLRAALAHGLRVRVAGARARAKVALTATARGRTVAAGRGRARAGGSATVTLRFTKAARRRLHRARSVRITVKGAGARMTITLRS